MALVVRIRPRTGTDAPAAVAGHGGAAARERGGAAARRRGGAAAEDRRPDGEPQGP
jgi:hypothetical protein